MIREAFARTRANTLEAIDLLAILLHDPDSIASDILLGLGLDGESVRKATAIAYPDKISQSDTRIKPGI